MTRDTLVRVALGATLWPVLFSLIAWAPMWGLHLLVAGVAAMAALETTQLADRDSTYTARWMAGTVAATITLAMGFLSLPVYLGLVASVGVVTVLADRLWLRGVGAQSLVLCYVAAPLALLVLLTKADSGRFWMSLALASTWSRDVGAFLIGRVTNGRPISAALSPRKTWMGALGGAVGAVACCLAFSAHRPSLLATADAVVVGIAVGILGQAGDLFESALKRAASSRHSSALLGAQGGVLDIIDGHLLTTPFISLYVSVQTGAWG